MSYATLCYVPKIPRLNFESFLRNVRAFKTAHPVIFFSDDPEPGWIKIEDPSEIKKSANRVSIQNIAFLHALKIAEKEGLSRFCYLELDCRVCYDNWDAALFNSCEHHKDMFCAGSYAVYNRKKFTPKQAASVDAAIARSVEATGFKVPEFTGRSDRPLGCLFIMGAGAVYPVPIIAELMMGYEREMAGKAVKIPAFDLWISLRCYQLFQERAPSKLPFIPELFSSYANHVNTEKDRIAMAKSGKWACVHQIKSSDDCLN